MIDCHAHIGEFETEIDEIVSRAKAENVIGVIMVPEYRMNFERNMQLAEKHPHFIFPALGLHPIQGSYSSPEESAACTLDDFEKAREFIRENVDRIVCIGEAGLDFAPKFIRKDTDKSDQIAGLRGQIELAMEFDLPLNLHSRSATPHVFKLLDDYSYYNCLMHAYDGKAKKAAFYAKKGCFFSVPNTAAREGSQMQNMVKLVPMENLVLETDSPALSLTPGERNEPKNLIISAQLISKVKSVPLDDVIRITTQNALRLFPKIKNFIRK